MEWVPIVFAIFKGSLLVIGMFYAIKWHHDQDQKAKDEAGGLQSPTEMRFFVAMIVALALSVIGIVYAGCWGHAADGGWGGALGCALTFLMCIMNTSSAAAVLPDRQGQAQAAQGGVHSEPATPAIQAEPLQAAFLARLESIEREKIYLGIAGLASAISWKYGDVAASWLNFG